MLPAVSKTLMHALLNENEFVDLNEILPKNRTPSHLTGEKGIVFDEATNQLKSKAGPLKSDVIRSSET